MTGPSCLFETIAVRHGMSVQRCVECRGLVVHAGCVSIRLDADAFDALRVVLNEARLVIDGHAPRGDAHEGRWGSA